MSQGRINRGHFAFRTGGARTLLDGRCEPRPEAPLVHQQNRHPRAGGDPVRRSDSGDCWIPACAGMTIVVLDEHFFRSQVSPDGAKQFGAPATPAIKIDGIAFARHMTFLLAGWKNSHHKWILNAACMTRSKRRHPPEFGKIDA
jgi:hypothetical protein